MKMIVGDKKENKRLLILVTIVIVIFLGFTVVAYVGMETALTYSWDNAGYYRSFIAYARDFNIKKEKSLQKQSACNLLRRRW